MEERKMNREILFKAKRIDNGEWVEGQYVYITNPLTEDGKPIKHLICNGTNIFNDLIDPVTLCQYTGLTDKDGKKIWENDIISIHAYSYDEPEDDYFGVVTYCEKDACWSLNNNEKYGEIICECFGSYTTEIINHGNIFDNPELLEVE
jgi:uncharacterized phage protein (TIGR01671 family)